MTEECERLHEREEGRGRAPEAKNKGSQLATLTVFPQLTPFLYKHQKRALNEHQLNDTAAFVFSVIFLNEGKNKSYN